MNSIKNKTCNEFEKEFWLFFDGNLSPQRMNFWQSHLKGCHICQNYMPEIDELMQNLTGNLIQDITDDRFNQMIVNAVSFERNILIGFIRRLRGVISQLKGKNKIRFAFGFAAILLLTLLFIIKPGYQHINSNEKADSIVTNTSNTQSLKVSDMVNLVYGNEMDKKLSNLTKEINKLKNN